LNVIGVVLGGLLGLMGLRQLSPGGQAMAKVTLGGCAVFFGLRLAWESLHGTFWDGTKQVVIAFLAMILGKMLGKVLRLQATSNRLGHYASERFANVKVDDPSRFSEGFTICSILFCVAPLALLGAVQDGLSDYWYTLAIKAAMDGMAMMTFVAVFGPGSLLAVVPLLIFQGTITLACEQYLEPFLTRVSPTGTDLVDAMNLTGAFLVLSVAVVILELKKVELTDYLPSLALAPMIAYIWA
jgi:hypothetical protein